MYEILTLIVICSCEAGKNVCRVLKDSTLWLWQPWRTSTTVTCPTDSSSNNVDSGPQRDSRSQVQTVCDWFILQELVVCTARGNSSATRPDRKSHTVTVPEVWPQLSTHCSSARNSREISSVANRPVKEQQHVTIYTHSINGRISN